MPIDVRDRVNGEQHALPRGLLKAAYDVYAVSPGEAPRSVEGCLLWDMSRAAHYIDHVFATAGLGAFRVGPEDAVGAPQLLP